MTRTRRAFRQVAPVLVLGLLVWATTGPQVSAHASFVRGAPGPGDVVHPPLVQVDTYFAQNIQRLSGQQTYSVWVTDAQRNQVDNNDNALDPTDPRHVTVTLPSGLAPGTYTVHWYTVSDEDGHEASGQYTFTLQGS